MLDERLRIRSGLSVCVKKMLIMAGLPLYLANNNEKCQIIYADQTPPYPCQAKEVHKVLSTANVNKAIPFNSRQVAFE